MALLKQMVKEMAAAGATAAHAVAGAPGSLFGGGVVDSNNARKKAKRGGRRSMKKMPMLKRVTNMTEGYIIAELIVEGGLGASSGETDFSSSDVVSKLDAQEKKSKAGEDTTAFGMEDEDGNLVKVYVRSESAEDFEKALAAMLAGEDENEDDANTALEIAEVLFKLKDKFEIVDVEWPSIEGDEEEEQEMEGGDEEGSDELGDATGDSEGGDLDAEGGDAEGDLEGGDDMGGDDMGADDESDAKSALDKVIDMMKADADAKKAEAEARKAEANAKEADAVARASQAKVTQEEQILDMEAHYKDKADVDKEAKQLAKMAKFRHDKAREAEGMMANEAVEAKKDNNPYHYNNEEDEEDEKEITSEELATLILKNLRHN